MQSITRVILQTGDNGRASFLEQSVPLDQGSPQVMLSRSFPAAELQLRKSPVGFRSLVHVTTRPQWVFILEGIMEIGLSDGTTRRFGAGEHFYSADILPAGAAFDPEIHGHWSRQVGDRPLVTLFVR